MGKEEDGDPVTRSGTLVIPVYGGKRAMGAWASQFHPFYFYALGIWLVLLALRSLWWQYRPVARCETCDSVGKVYNRLRGTWFKELLWFILFVPAGIVFIVLLDFYFGYFLMRWFVVRECANCGSERLLYGKLAVAPVRE